MEELNLVMTMDANTGWIEFNTRGDVFAVEAVCDIVVAGGYDRINIDTKQAFPGSHAAERFARAVLEHPHKVINMDYDWLVAIVKSYVDIYDLMTSTGVAYMAAKVAGAFEGSLDCAESNAAQFAMAFRSIKHMCDMSGADFDPVADALCACVDVDEIMGICAIIEGISTNMGVGEVRDALGALTVSGMCSITAMMLVSLAMADGSWRAMAGEACHDHVEAAATAARRIRDIRRQLEQNYCSIDDMLEMKTIANIERWLKKCEDETKRG